MRQWFLAVIIILSVVQFDKLAEALGERPVTGGLELL